MPKHKWKWNFIFEVWKSIFFHEMMTSQGQPRTCITHKSTVALYTVSSTNNYITYTTNTFGDIKYCGLSYDLTWSIRTFRYTVNADVNCEISNNYITNWSFVIDFDIETFGNSKQLQSRIQDSGISGIVPMSLNIANLM